GKSDGESEQPDYEPGPDVPTWAKHRVQFVGLHPLVRSPYLVNVRHFHLGNVETSDNYGEWEGSYTLGIAAADLIAKMPRIEEVSLWTRGVKLKKLFSLPMPHLRRLQVHHVAERYPLKALAANLTLTKLTTLQLHPHYHREFIPERSRYFPNEPDDDDTDP